MIRTNLIQNDIISSMVNIGLAMIFVFHDGVGLTIGMDLLLIKNFDGHVEESPPCIGWFKTQNETLHSSFSFEGFLCTKGVLHGHERPAGSSFVGSVVCSIVLHYFWKC